MQRSEIKSRFNWDMHVLFMLLTTGEASKLKVKKRGKNLTKKKLRGRRADHFKKYEKGDRKKRGMNN